MDINIDSAIIVPSICNSHEPRSNRIGLLLGDPSGIGPELVASLLFDNKTIEQTEILIIGSKSVLLSGATTVSTNRKYTKPIDSNWINELCKTEKILLDEEGLASHTERSCGFPMGQINKKSGEYVLNSIQVAVMALRANRIGALVFGPFNKQSMNLAGLTTEGELDYFAQLMDYRGLRGEVNILPLSDKFLWTSRVTSHIPLQVVSSSINRASIVNSVQLIHQTLLDYGYKRPKIAVAGLNPHAGEGGLFGQEEIELIKPAIQVANEKFDIQAVGPLSPDTIFVRAKNGEFDAVVTMYHDQGQIAMKLMGFEQGITLQAGLPWIVTTPAHGTAFDIAGKGIAKVSAFREAFTLARKMIS